MPIEKHGDFFNDQLNLAGFAPIYLYEGGGYLVQCNGEQKICINSNRTVVRQRQCEPIGMKQITFLLKSYEKWRQTLESKAKFKASILWDDSGKGNLSCA